MRPKVSVVAILNDSKESDDIIASLSRQSLPGHQLVLIATNKYAFDSVSSVKDGLNVDDCIIDITEGNDALEMALKLSTGDFVWICESGDDTHHEYLDRMLTIERNLGVDVVISDYGHQDGPNDKKDDIRLYYGADVFLSSVGTSDHQWIKFFRRSLIGDEKFQSIGDLVQIIKKNASAICHYRRNMFSGDHKKGSYGKFALGCSWRYEYDDLMNIKDLDESRKIPITIGICAYNEQYVIEKTVKSIFSQHAGSFVIEKVIIVSSGSTDDTNSIIEKMCKDNALIHPIYQEKREGKNSAVNEVIRNSSTEVIVLYNADNVFASEYTLDMLIRPLFSDEVGMTGGHPIPTNSRNNIPDYTVQLMWSVHHNASMLVPNMGELIAFKNVGIELPTDMQGDEAIIRYFVEKRGLRLEYVPVATLYNKGPTTTEEFLKQRKRVNIGEMNVKSRYGLEHATHSSKVLAKAFWRSLKDIGFQPMKTPVAVMSELSARVKARIYVRKHKEDISVWEQVGSTKKL